MDVEINELTTWLNYYDEQLIFRLKASQFRWLQIEPGVYEIKNNLGKIWVKKNMFLISFNNGWSLISTFHQDNDWVSLIKAQFVEKKTALILSSLPSYRLMDFSSLVCSLWSKAFRKPLVTWEHLTLPEIMTYIVPYLKKTKQDYREGRINNFFPFERQLKEIEQELFKIQSGPEIVKLIALLET